MLFITSLDRQKHEMLIEYSQHAHTLALDSQTDSKSNGKLVSVSQYSPQDLSNEVLVVEVFQKVSKQFIHIVYSEQVCDNNAMFSSFDG